VGRAAEQGRDLRTGSATLPSRTLAL